MRMNFWIEPSAFRPAVGTDVALTLYVGEDFAGDSLPHITDWYATFMIAAPDGDHPAAGELDDDPAGRFPISVPGIHVVGYRSVGKLVEMAGEDFTDYLRIKGLERIIGLRLRRGEDDAPATEFFSRCAKAVLAAGGQPLDTGFDRNLGFTLELIPEKNPYTLTRGDILPVRLLYEGRPLQGALVVAFTRDEPAAKLRARTDVRGRVDLELSQSGVWLVTAVHMIFASPSLEAEWESLWASLTFELVPD